MSLATAVPAASLAERQPSPGRVDLAVTGSMTARNSRSLHVAFRRIVDRGARHVVVDLSSVGDIDPAGVAVLLVYARLLRSLGGLLEVAAASPECRDLLSRMPRTQLDELMPALADPLTA
jgi:anti-anti-sigma regulatory factor